jgi:hypothetical protein
MSTSLTNLALTDIQIDWEYGSRSQDTVQLSVSFTTQYSSLPRTWLLQRRIPKGWNVAHEACVRAPDLVMRAFHAILQICIYGSLFD